MKSKIVTLAMLTAAFAAGAADVGQHPAVFAPRTLPGIDASTFIPGHPAGGKAGRPAPSSTAAAPAGAPSAESADKATVPANEQKLAQRAPATLR